MPRIKVTRCILALTVISLLGFLSLSLWMESSRRSKSDEDYINLLFKATLSPNFHHRSPSNNTTQTSSSSTGIGENIEKTKRKKMTLFSPEEVQEFWASFTTRRPWFMKNGEVRPDPANPSFHSLPLWPSEDPDSDRIINQLMYIPSNYKEAKSDGKLKKIFLFHGRSERSNLGLPLGRKQFLLDECPVNTCELTIDPQDIEEADAIYFKNWFQYPTHRRSPSQVWILFLLESPPNTQAFYNLNNVINWTATFRHDSDLVAPYEKYFMLPSLNEMHFKSRPTSQQSSSELPLNNIQISSHSTPESTNNETKNELEWNRNKVAWFVSNCGAKNSRLEYARELSKYIDVDIFGSCGTKRCPRSAAKECFELMNENYKYYLAFENSNCIDYITEKYFVNGLMNNVVPIVMGARKEDYIRSSPANSFIHVDDFESPKDLAIFLHQLNRDPLKYSSYLEWKQSSGEFINTFFWCRLCALLHSPRATSESHSYSDIHSWWNHPGTCSSSGWKK